MEFDRCGFVNFWIALDEVPPERGSMRFYNGSHRAGPLGLRHVMEGGNESIDLLETYPKLAEKYPLSPPLHYQPGDATAHGMLTVHHAPPNTTDETRWAYSAFYLSSDVRRIASPSTMHGDQKVGELVDGPATPLISAPLGSPNGRIRRPDAARRDRVPGEPPLARRSALVLGHPRAA